MSIDPHGPAAGGALPSALPLRCSGCGTDRRLSIKSIDALCPPSETLVEVSYTCTACGLFYTHHADVAEVAVILNRVGRTSEVLAVGGHYIHCGQPMQKAGSELRRLQAVTTTDQDTTDALDVYLSTRVLRCLCGFQMELPA